MEVVTLLKTLIDIPSITGNEAAVGAFLVKTLTAMGLSVTTIPVGGERINVLAQSGQPRVILQAHMDVVPPHLPAGEDDAYVFGRGSCDTKGSIASMIVAAQQALAAGATDFGLLFTVGEEVDFAGAQATQKLVSELGAFLIVGEPSGLKVVNAHFGILALRIVCKGVPAHSSEPQLGKNAIDALVSVLAGPVRSLELGEKTLMSVVRISGGVADNIIPEAASATLSFRIAPGDSRDYVALLTEALSDAASVEAPLSLAPVATQLPPQLAFLGEGMAVKYCTELSFFKNGIVLGPGDIADAHTAQEKVSKQQLSEAVALYTRIVQAFQ